MTILVHQRYEVGALVASGGMADVYRGHDRVLDRPVAIKRLRGSMDATARARFDREARVLAGFQHPNAVAVYDAVEDGAGPVIVMEYVEGRTLRAVLRAESRLPVDEAVTIADQLLAALAAAHARGIVHRDIKPGNVLVSDEGYVKLADFGIATMADAADVTHTGEVLGTPKYLSPEQVAGRRATPRSDLYAVGVLCFEMVCGRVPFDGDTAAATMAAHQRAPVPSLRERCPGVPDEYVAVVERALAKDPERRYGTAEEMRAALRSVAGDDVTDTVVDSTRTLPVAVASQPAWTPAHRRRSGWAVLMLLVLTLGALAVFGAWVLGADTPAGRPSVPTATAPATTPRITRTVPTTPPTTAPRALVPGHAGGRGGDGSGPGNSGNAPGHQGRG